MDSLDQERKLIAEENKNFSYEDFLGGEYEDCGATVIITSNQSVTIMNDKDGKGGHDEALYRICQAIHDLPDYSEENDKQYWDLLNEMIRIKILTKGKSIASTILYITFPRYITQGMLEQLKAYNKKVGDEINNASREMKSKIIGWDGNKSWDDYRKTDNFDDVIAYAEQLPICNNINGREEFIVGDTIITGLPEVLRNALTTATIEECDSADHAEKKNVNVRGDNN